MSAITAPSEIDVESLPDAPDEEWLRSFLKFDNERGRQVVAAINAQRETAFVDVDLKHAVATPRANPLSVPIAGIEPVRCFGINVDSTNKPSGGFYALGIPQIEWHPSTKADGSVIITPKFPLTINGAVGERIVEFITSASAATLTNNTAKSINGITITAGTWDVTLEMMLTGNLTGTYFGASISTSTNTMSGATGDSEIYTPTLSNGSSDNGVTVANVRQTVTASTSVYGVAVCGFSGGTAKAYGRISAVRVVDAYSISAPLGRVRLQFTGEPA